MEDIVINSDRKCPVALPCRRLRNINSFTPQGKVAAEISRCLHEVSEYEIESIMANFSSVQPFCDICCSKGTRRV